MATKVFKSKGALNVKRGSTWTMADLPSISVGAIDAIVVAEAPRIWTYEYDEYGAIVIDKDRKPKRVQRHQRGVRVLISSTQMTYTSAGDNNVINVPTLYKEGEEIGLDPTNTYTFQDSCTIEYGVYA
jgi:hypothetical protein